MLQAQVPEPKKNPELRRLICVAFYKRYRVSQTPATAWVPTSTGQSQLLCPELGPSNLTPYQIRKSEQGLERPQGRPVSPTSVSSHLDWWTPIFTTLYSS